MAYGLLDRLPPAFRRRAQSLFLNAVRRAIKEPRAICEDVVRQAADQHEVAQFFEGEGRTAWQVLGTLIQKYPQEAEGLAAWAIHWQSLTPDERADRSGERPPLPEQVKILIDYEHWGPVRSEDEARELIKMYRKAERDAQKKQAQRAKRKRKQRFL